MIIVGPFQLNYSVLFCSVILLYAMLCYATHLIPKGHSSVRSNGPTALPGSAHLGRSTSAVAPGWRTAFSQGNLSSLCCAVLHVQCGLHACAVLHRSLGHRKTSGAHCHRGACRQLPRCTGHSATCLALPVPNSAARSSHENVVSV